MAARDVSLRIYWALRDVIAPELVSSQEAYAATVRAHVNEQVRWLDLGCGHQALADWHAEDERRLVTTCHAVVGLDGDLGSLARHRSIGLRVGGDISRLPFKDACFELVTLNMVVEHLRTPSASFAEIARILKSGGTCIVLTPNANAYTTFLARSVPAAVKRRAVRILEGRKAVDVFPAYYRANTPRRVKQLSAASSLRVVSVAMLTTDAVFAVVPPVAALELLWIRLLMTRPFRGLRPNMLAVLRKSASA
jgi:ubiquinone/menaquinone biosynthesis C-methylase UbiE